MKRTAIYVISAGPAGPCKIGVSTNPQRRLEELQTGAPRKLTIEYVAWMRKRSQARRAEAQLHWIFGDRSLEGEWFDDPPRLLLSQIPSHLDHWGLPS